ncbi:MAG: hypothetical protein B6U89_00830 [Desulfurococcales archaeon ex4484_58]|nr:MAG: hypothetical protein B6U89_00830 [Desulfurococcales archaeon ex4484_58]
MRNKSVAGIVLLVIALTIYLWNAYINLSYREIYDDMVSWFHLHVINYIRNNDDLTNDRVLRYFEGRDLTKSPIFLDLLLAYTGLSPNIWTLIMGFLYILLIYIISYIITKNHIASGLSAMLLATVPTFTYWFRYNMIGSYTLQVFWFILLLTLSYILRYGKHYLYIVIAIINAIIWIGWSNGWVVLFIYSFYLLALIYKGILDKRHLLIGLVLLLTSLPLNLVFNTYYVTQFHVFSLILLIVSLIMGFLVYKASKTIGEYGFIVSRLIYSFSAFPISIYLHMLLSNYIEFPGISEDYMKVYNPIFDYGVIGLFSLLALIIVIRSKVLQDIRNEPLPFMLLSSFIVGVLLAYFIHPLSVIAIASIAPFVSFSYVIIASSLYRVSSDRARYIYFAVAIWIIVGSIIGNAIPSYSIASTPPNIYYQDIYRELLKKYKVNESSLLKALDVLKSNLTGEALIIAYWGYSYWITGYMGVRASTIADNRGSVFGQKIIASIFMSDEETAYNLIKILLGNKTDREVYVIVSETVSVNLNELRRGYKIVDLGSVIMIPPTAPDERTKTSFKVFGDLDRVFEYIELSGLDVNQYMDIAKARYTHEVSLAWRHAMLDSLMVKLVVNALKENGYDVINDVYSELPMHVSGLHRFRLVNMTLTPLYRVTEDIYDYQIYYMTAIYKVEL